MTKKMNSTLIKYIYLSFLLIVITEFTKHILNLDELMYNSLAEKITKQQLNDFFAFQQKRKWIGYVFVLLYVLLKTIIIASILYIGVFFSNKDLSFKKIWNLILDAEFILLLVPIIKIIWFYFFQTNYTFEDIQYFYPLSALNIVSYKGLEPWFIYPFQTLNLFELGYWLILAYYIGKATETNMDKGLKIVTYSYGSALLLWVVTVMFFTLNYS